MLDAALKSLGCLALAVSFVAGLIAIVPIMLWISFGLLANSLMDKR
jgi:hypothetical protein|tara:strand:+ start:605 stop:742 length:138 start_codon:yes stop_codon:yes gene_type:complete